MPFYNVMLLWKDYINEYMEELFRKGVKWKEKEEQLHKFNSFIQI